MRARIIIFIILMISAFILTSCGGAGDVTTDIQTDAVTETETESTAKDTEEYVYTEITKSVQDDEYYNAENISMYYVPDVFDPVAVPCRVNIKTGEINYACPVSGCDHSGDKCFYYRKVITSVLDTGNYMFIKAYIPTENKPCIYSFCYETGEINELELSPDTQYYLKVMKYFIGYNSGVLYMGTTNNSTSAVYEVDLHTGVAKIRNMQQRYANTSFYYNEGELIINEGKYTGVNVIDGEGNIKKIRLPDGTDGYKLRKKGFLYKTDAPAGIYDTKSAAFLDIPADIDITSPVKDGDDYYFQSRGPAETAKTAEGEEIKYVRYDNGIYRYGADGKTEKYTSDTDYHFIIYAADDGFVIGRLMYKLDDGVITPFDTLEYDHIRIDLSTGQIQLLKLYAL